MIYSYLLPQENFKRKLKAHESLAACFTQQTIDKIITYTVISRVETRVRGDSCMFDSGWAELYRVSSWWMRKQQLQQKLTSAEVDFSRSCGLRINRLTRCHRWGWHNTEGLRSHRKAQEEGWHNTEELYAYRQAEDQHKRGGTTLKDCVRRDKHKKRGGTTRNRNACIQTSVRRVCTTASL